MNIKTKTGQREAKTRSKFWITKLKNTHRETKINKLKNGQREAKIRKESIDTVTNSTKIFTLSKEFRQILAKEGFFLHVHQTFFRKNLKFVWITKLKNSPRGAKIRKLRNGQREAKTIYRYSNKVLGRTLPSAGGRCKFLRR